MKSETVATLENTSFVVWSLQIVDVKSWQILLYSISFGWQGQDVVTAVDFVVGFVVAFDDRGLTVTGVVKNSVVVKNKVVDFVVFVDEVLDELVNGLVVFVSKL